MRRQALLGAMLALLVTCACGSVATRANPKPSLAEMQVLASSEVPGVPSVTSVLTVGELTRDASIPGLAAKLTSWGYLDGRERVFQGNSRHLTLVVSRSLIFIDAAGARGFVAFVQANSGAFFGGVGGRQPLEAQGRSGWLFSPPLCACHMANPAIAGVLDAGAGVVWLEINGPDATPALLVNLLDPARSVPTTLAD
jgi:hypothetical protein